MNPELTYTLELARSMDRFVRGVDASQEKVKWEGRPGCPDRGAKAAPTLAFSRAIKRGHEAIISMLQKACSELAPTDGAEIGKLIRVLEYGEIPAPKATKQRCDPQISGTQIPSQINQSLNGARPRRIHKNNLRKSGPRESADNHSADPPLPSDEKSREVMAQWR